MAIRTNTNPRQMDLQPEMRNMLMRNGLQAHVALDGSGYRLIVQGHNSPLLVYPISERQMLALTDWGTNTANKKAYNVLTSIVGKDFYMPKNFVHARNANGRVAMGLHGYRIGIGEYGRMGRMGMPPPFLGWTPRNQWGLHLRRVGGQLFFPGPSIVPERPDGRMKPGELQSGGYGFYYKASTGATRTATGRSAGLAGGHHADGQPSAQRGTGTVVQGAYSLSGLFFQREIGGVPCLARSCRGCGKADADCAVGKRPSRYGL